MRSNKIETHLTKTERTIFVILGCLTVVLAYFCFRNGSIHFIALGLVLPLLLSFWMVYLETDRTFKEAEECLMNRIAEKGTEDIEDESREIDWGELRNNYGPSWLAIMLALYAFSAIPLFSFLFSLDKEEWLYSLFVMYLSSPIFGMSFAKTISFRKLSKDMEKLKN